MRNAFISTLCGLAQQDKSICLMTGDLGYNVVENFASAFPGRFYNAGICEQNMASMAAGMALEGKKVFLYSIANFPTIRCLEQIRNDIAYHNAHVVVVTVGGGFTYGAMGVSHHTTEDIGMMRCIPNMTILTPSDPYETEVLTAFAVQNNGPSWLRLGKTGEKQLKAERDAIRIGQARMIRKADGEGKKVAVFTIGPIAQEAITAAGELEVMGVSCSVYTVPCIKPVVTEEIVGIAEKSDLVCTLEEHNIIGGLGSMMAEILSGSGLGVRLLRFGLQDIFSSAVGDQCWLRKYYGMDAESIVRKIVTAMGGRTGVMAEGNKN